MTTDDVAFMLNLTLERSRETNSLQAGLLEEAESMSQTTVAGNPDDHETLHVLGVLASRQRRDDVALTLLCRAVKLAPLKPQYHADLADVLARKGMLTLALAASLQAVRLGPAEPVFYCRLAQHLTARRELASAIAMLREAVKLAPADPRAHRALGDALYTRGALAEAREHYDAALRLGDDTPEIHLRIGRVFARCGGHAEALVRFRTGLQSCRDNADLHAARGDAFVRLGALPDAIEAYRAAHRQRPFDPKTARQLVCTLERAGHANESVGGWLALARALHAAMRFADAVVAYKQVLMRRPDSIRALMGIGRALLGLGQAKQAVPYFKRVIALEPEHQDAHLDLGNAHHLLGDTARGWDEFCWFYDPAKLRSRWFEQPVWDGTPLGRRTILLWTEMGRGDTILFLRYIAFVKDHGGRIIVESHHRGLVPLIESIPGVTHVAVPGEALPDFDVHAPLTLFPARYPASRGRADAVPYLRINPLLVETWRQRLASDQRMTIGISWAGNTDTVSAAGRFLTLSAFAPLATLEGIRLVSLQHGPQVAEALVASRALRLEHLMGDANSIEDAAALMLNLDLVITVDTMIAHLAGALGVRTWTLLRHATNCWWRLEGDRTPWYPTMRLFRQTEIGAWAGVLERVRTSLDMELRGRRET